MDVIKHNVEVLRPVFTKIGTFTWHYDTFVQSLKPKYSEDGSNKKTLEVTTYKAFLDVVEYSFNAGSYILLLLHLNMSIKQHYKFKYSAKT